MGVVTAHELVRDRVDGLRDELIATLSAAVRIPSVTPTYAGQTFDDLIGAESEVSRLLADVYRSAGAEVDLFAVEPGRENAVGIVRGSGAGRSLILNGHVDVVPADDAEEWASGDPFDGRLEGECVWGRGSVDMKGGLVAQAFAARALREAGVALGGDLILQAVVGEETLEHEKGTSATLARGYSADAAIVAEPTGWAQPLTVMPATPGVLVMQIEVEGRTAHAMMRSQMIRAGGRGAEAGVSAIDRGFAIYEALRRLEDEWGIVKRDPLFDPGQFTLPLGIVDGGARHARTGAFVPDRMTLLYGVGHPPDDDSDAVKREIEECVQHVAANDPWLRENPPRIEWLLSYPGSRLRPDHPLCASVAAAREQAAADSELAGAAAIAGFPSAADSTWFAAAGIPALCFGPGWLDRAHARDERCPVEELVCATRAYALAALDWCGLG
jgi:acetylornithine deacetylase